MDKDIIKIYKGSVKESIAEIESILKKLKMGERV